MDGHANVAPTSPMATSSDASAMGLGMGQQDYLAPLFDPDIDLTDSMRSPSPGDLWVERQFEARFRPFVFPLEPLKYDPDPKPFEEPDRTPAVAEAEEAYWRCVRIVATALGMIPSQFRVDARNRIGIPVHITDDEGETSEKETKTETDNELVTRESRRSDLIDSARSLRSLGRPIEAAYQYCIEPPTTEIICLEFVDAMWEAAHMEAKERLDDLYFTSKIHHSLKSYLYSLPALKLVHCLWISDADNRIYQLVNPVMLEKQDDPDDFGGMFAAVCLYHYLLVACAMSPIWFHESLGSGSFWHAQRTCQTRLLALCKRLTLMKQDLPGDRYRFLRRRLTWAVQQCCPYLSAPGLDLILGGLSLDIPISAVDLIAADERQHRACEETCRELDSLVARLSGQLCKIIRLSKQFILTEADALSLFGLAREYVDTLQSKTCIAAVCDFCSAMLMIDTPFFLARRSASRWAAYAVCTWSRDLSASTALAMHPRGFLVSYILCESARSMGAPRDTHLDEQPPHSGQVVKVLPNPLRSLRVGPEIPLGSAREVQTYFARHEVINFCSSFFASGPEDPLYMLLHEANHILDWEQHNWRLTRALAAGRRARENVLNGLVADEDFEAARNVLAFGDIRGPGGSQLEQAEQLIIALQRLCSMAKQLTSRQSSPTPFYSRKCEVFALSLEHFAQLIHCLCGDTVVQLAQMSKIVTGHSYSLAKEAYGIAIRCRVASWSGDSYKLVDRARSRLLELEASMCQSGIFPGGVPAFLESCLRTERSIRKTWLMTYVEDLIVETPLSTRQTLEHQQYESHTAEAIQTVQHFSRSICLLHGRDLEAFWWQQRTKAALASMFVAQRQNAAVLLALEYDPDDQAENHLSRVDQNTRRALTDLKSRFRARPFDGSMSRSVIPQAGLQIRKTQLTVRPDLRSMAERFAIAKASHERPSSLGFVDWVEDLREDRYHMTVARSWGGVTHINISIQVTPSKLMTWLTHSWGEQRVALDRPEEVSELRDLDPLVLELGRFTAPGEHMIFCPTGLLHQLPLHALWVAYDTPIETRNQITYAANLFAYDACERRGMTGSSGRISSSEASVAITSIYRPLPGQRVTKAFERNQQGLRAAVTKLAEPAGRSLIWDEDVDRESMTHLLQNSKALLYIGHCVLLQPDEGLPPKCHMVLADGTFGEDDMLALAIPGSLLILTACESSFQLISPLDEPLGLPTAALVAGAATVIGTLWPVRIHPAVYFSERLFEWLTDPSTKEADGMRSVAKAMHLAVVDVRKAYRNSRDWAGYVLHGSPRMKDIFAQEGPPTIGAKEGGRLLVGANEQDGM